MKCDSREICVLALIIYLTRYPFSNKLRYINRINMMYRVAAFILVLAICLTFLKWPWYLTMALSIPLLILTGGLNWIRIAWKTLGRDIFGAYKLLSVELKVKNMVKQKIIVADILEDDAKKCPDKIAFISAETNESLTFKEANDFANKIANIFYEAGYRKGDVVALMMENSCEFYPILMGLSKIGIVTGLINTNLRGDSLKHCINIIDCKAVIFSEDMKAAICDIKKQLNTRLFYFGSSRSAEDVKTYTTLLKMQVVVHSEINQKISAY